MALNIHEKGFTISKTKLVGKKWKKSGPFCVSKVLFWRQKLVASTRHGNSPVVRRVSPGRINVVLFWTKYAVPRQIKPRILKLTTSRGQSNLRAAFYFCYLGTEKGCCCIVSLGHQNFDCRSYCGLIAVCKVISFITSRCLGKKPTWVDRTWETGRNRA